MEDPEPVMQQLVRVFIGEGTYCPGFQFLAGGLVHPTVLDLFQRAMALKIPHNHFTLWMVSPSPALAGARPVELLETRPPALFRALEALGRK
ncbi:MbcA/ParS/Xre antitoxin family protein [Arthrobacter sp. D1-29]